MTRVVRSFTIKRPIEEVFGYITGLDTVGEWQHGVVRSELREGDTLRQGAEVVETRRLLGRELAMPWKVTVYRPPRVRGFKVTSRSLEIEDTMTFDETDAGTTVQFIADIRGARGLGFLAPILGRALGFRTARDFGRAKRLLETNGRVPEGVPCAGCPHRREL